MEAPFKFKTYRLVVEKFDGTKVVLDPFSEDGVFLASIGQFSSHAPSDVGIEPEDRLSF